MIQDLPDDGHASDCPRKNMLRSDLPSPCQSALQQEKEENLGKYAVHAKLQNFLCYSSSWEVRECAVIKVVYS